MTATVASRPERRQDLHAAIADALQRIVEHERRLGEALVNGDETRAQAIEREIDQLSAEITGHRAAIVRLDETGKADAERERRRHAAVAEAQRREAARADLIAWCRTTALDLRLRAEQSEALAQVDALGKRRAAMAAEREQYQQRLAAAGVPFEQAPEGRDPTKLRAVADHFDDLARQAAETPLTMPERPAGSTPAARLDFARRSEAAALANLRSAEANRSPDIAQAQAELDRSRRERLALEEGLARVD